VSLLLKTILLSGASNAWLDRCAVLGISAGIALLGFDDDVVDWLLVCFSWTCICCSNSIKRCSKFFIRSSSVCSPLAAVAISVLKATKESDKYFFFAQTSIYFRCLCAVNHYLASFIELDLLSCVI
jgi:hypothetical protein